MNTGTVKIGGGGVPKPGAQALPVGDLVGSGRYASAAGTSGGGMKLPPLPAALGGAKTATAGAGTDKLAAVNGGGSVAPAGGGAGAGGGAAAGGVAGGGNTSTNTAQISPYLQQQIGRYNSRFGDDVSQRAINKSNLAVSDAAALSAADLKGNMSRRGVLGTSTGAAFLDKRVFAPARAEAADQASKIAMGEEARKDALTLGGTGLMTAPDAVSLSNRQLALQQSEAQAADARARAQMERDQQDRALSQYIALSQLALQAQGGQ